MNGRAAKQNRKDEIEHLRNDLQKCRMTVIALLREMPDQKAFISDATLMKTVTQSTRLKHRHSISEKGTYLEIID